MIEEYYSNRCLHRRRQMRKVALALALTTGLMSAVVGTAEPVPSTVYPRPSPTIRGPSSTSKRRRRPPTLGGRISPSRTRSGSGNRSCSKRTTLRCASCSPWPTCAVPGDGASAIRQVSSATRPRTSTAAPASIGYRSPRTSEAMDGKHSIPLPSPCGARSPSSLRGRLSRHCIYVAARVMPVYNGW